MTPEPLAYFNGKFLPASQATLSLDDLGFVQGVIITDRLRTFRNRLFRLEEHLQRFRQSCELAFVPQPRSDEELAAAATELIEANVTRRRSICEWSLVIFATPGTGEPTLGMQAVPLQVERYRGLFTHGEKLTPFAAAPTSPPLDPRIKHRSRLAWWTAEHAAGLPGGYNHQLLFTTTGPAPCIRETPIANFLVEFDGTLISPPRSQILNGVSLQVVEELCRTLGILFEEREVRLAEVLSHHRQCLLTNTSFCVAPVSQIAETEKSSDAIIFKRLIKSWSDLVGVDIQEQFFI